MRQDQLLRRLRYLTVRMLRQMDRVNKDLMEYKQLVETYLVIEDDDESSKK